MATRTTTGNQVRGFALVWTVITFIVAMATFLAIYFTYSDTDINIGNPPAQGGVIPVATTSIPVVVMSSPTPRPTLPPTNTAVPTGTPTTVIVAQAAPTDALPTLTPTEIPPTPTLLPVDDRVFQPGIQVQESLDFNPDNQDGFFGAVANQLQLEWIKQQVRWEVMEPEQGNINWGVLDLVIPSAQRAGLKVMLSIVTAPEWSREPGVNLSQHGPPDNPQDYADFVAAILNRYPGQIHAIEVWNEQNIDREWTSVNGVQAAAYVDLLRVTHDTVRAIDPGLIIISGALSPTGYFGGCAFQGCDDQLYMEMLINAGMLNYADCVGAHHNGYNISPSVTWDAVPNDPTAIFRGPFDNPHISWAFRSTLQGYSVTLARMNSEHKLCVTEFGWPASEDIGGFPPSFEFAADNTLDEQAEFLVEALGNMEEWGTIWLAFIWNFNYGPQAGYDPNNDNVPYSLIGPGYTFRPAYDAVAEWQADYLERIGR